MHEHEADLWENKKVSLKSSQMRRFVAHPGSHRGLNQHERCFSRRSFSRRARFFSFALCFAARSGLHLHALRHWHGAAPQGRCPNLRPILFGLHLVGALIKLNLRAGIVLGVILVALGVAAYLRHAPLFAGLGASHFFSLSLIGFFGPSMARWLNRDVHLRSNATQPGIWSGFLLGFAFAFGWTPCIGPILATVLALAAASDTIARGVLLLAVYSAGLAIPFLLTALGISQFMVFYKNFRKYLHAVELFSGALLLFVGGLVFVNKLTWLSSKLTFLNRFSL